MPIAAQQGRHGVTGQAQVPGVDPGISAADRSLRPGRAGGRVGVTRLVLTDFRNYHSARLDLDPGPVVVTGPNGAGKTNLLEAVSFLSPGRGLRHARLLTDDENLAEHCEHVLHQINFGLRTRNHDRQRALPGAADAAAHRTVNLHDILLCQCHNLMQ